MTTEPKILAFAGSARAQSFNKKLLRIAAAGARAAGAPCTEIDLREHPLPIYDGDLEASHGLPEAAAGLRELLASHAGLLIASPEYNSSITPLLKNTIDWMTRSRDAKPDPAVFRGKAVALLAASPGPLGGLRGLFHLRSLLAALGCIVLPEQVTIRNAAAAFDASGALIDPAHRTGAEALGARLAEVVGRLHGGS